MYGVPLLSLSGESNPESQLPLSDPGLQAEMDSLQNIQLQRSRGNRRFNPNYLTDYEAYLVGLTPAQLEKIREYRKSGHYITEPAELEGCLGPGVRVPEAIIRRLYFPPARDFGGSGRSRDYHISALDLNQATRDQLERLPGIGTVLAGRILRFRSALSGFRTVTQLRDVYGLSPELADRLIRGGIYLTPPADSSRIRLSTASPSQLKGFPYFSEQDAERIVSYRNANQGRIEIDELSVLLHFSKEKFDRIALYLQ